MHGAACLYAFLHKSTIILDHSVDGLFNAGIAIYVAEMLAYFDSFIYQLVNTTSTSIASRTYVATS